MRDIYLLMVQSSLQSILIFLSFFLCRWLTNVSCHPIRSPGFVNYERKSHIKICIVASECNFKECLFSLLCTKLMTQPTMMKFLNLDNQCSFSILWCKSISKGVQYVTPDSKIYCEKVKMCWFSSRNWFFHTKFVQLAEAGKRRNTVVHLPKRVS